MSKKHHIIPIFIPHRGCPHDCIFCNQKKITGLSTEVTGHDIDNIIKDFIKTIPHSNKQLEVAFFGGSFTSIDISIQKELLEVASRYKAEEVIDKIRLSTRPDCIDDERLSLLKSYSVDIIELGIQSMDEEVLENSFRGHSSEDVKKAVDLIKRYNFKLGLQMMIGLPKDNKEKSLFTAKEIIKLKPHFVRIYPTLVVKDTYLEKMFIEGKYEPLTIEEAVEISTELLMLFTYNEIQVIRIGLQPTENISQNGDVVAGPFHPSFRQLVESNVYKIVLSELLNQVDVNDILTVKVNRREISNFVGQKRKNIIYVKEKYNIKNIKIVGEDIPKTYFYIQQRNKQQKIVLIDYIKKYLIKRKLIT